MATSGPACALVVDGDRIVEADADGLERSLVGLTLLEAAAVPGERLAADALANALGPVFQAVADPARIAVAMSGGVDSAVALLRAGPAAVGVTLRLWIDPKGPDSERACCSPEAVIAARETCHALGIPHVTLDAREAFRRAIVQPFVEGYARGETPNPCTRCNGSFRFAQLLEFTRRAGAARLATGHYARIVEHRGRLCLRARPTSGRTSRTCSPGSILVASSESGSRSVTRRRRRPARRRSARACSVAQRPESQEACFLGGGDYREFLERHGLPAREGAVVDEEGATVGVHQGFWRFTPGQRRGLGVSAGRPAYAIRNDPKTNTVVVGPLEALARRSVTATGHLFASVTRGDAKLRYRSPALPADVEATADGFRLCFDEPAYGVAPGQTAVVYEDDVVVGSGTIASSAA